MHATHEMPVRVAELERSSARHANRLTDVEHACDRLAHSLGAIVRRVTVFSALGALAGGAIVAGIVTALQ